MDEAPADWKQDLSDFAKQFIAEAVVMVVGVVLVIWYRSRAH